MHVVFDNGAPARVARLAQALVDLLVAVRVGIKPAHDLALEGIKLAHALHTGAWVELLHIGPLGHRTNIQSQCTRGLCHAELLSTQVVADLAKRLMVEHGCAPSR